MTRARLADIFTSRGPLDEALRIRRDEALPMLLRRGDTLHIAKTRVGAAEVLAARGPLDDAPRDAAGV